jgi:putative NADH-flavin reductase
LARKKGPMKKIAVFGASGRTGKLFTELALQNGNEVKALVRQPSRLGFQHSNLQIIQGDCSDPSKVGETVKATHVVVDLLGPGKGSSLDLQRTATAHILHAMEQNNVKRLLVLASLPFGILDPNDKPTFVNRFMMAMAKNLVGGMVEDARAHVNLIKQSKFDWTVVRAPALSDEPSPGKYRVGYLDRQTGKSISRSDVAAFILDILNSGTYIRQMPLLSN